MYDLLVIGGGPGGYHAAKLAGSAGMKTLLFEKSKLGGVCLNEGCIPTKALLNSAKALDSAKKSETLGVKITGVEYDHNAVVDRKNYVVKKLVAGVAAQMRASNVEVVNGTAFIKDRTHVSSNGETYECKNMMIATGSTTIIPPIPGLAHAIETGFAMTSREILDLREIPEKLVVIGGGVIGLEMASYFNSAGSNVTVVEMLPKVGGTIENEISKTLMDIYEKKGVKFMLNTMVSAIGEDKVMCVDAASASGKAGNGNASMTAGDAANQSARGDFEVASDKVLLSIGRRPAIDGIGLDNASVEIYKGAVSTDAHMRTNVPNIYAIGDVNGKYMLAHTAYREAEVAVNHMLGRQEIMRYDAVPSVIYTTPEAACVGETGEGLEEKGIKSISASLPMMFSGRAVAENNRPDGFCKLIFDEKTRRIAGAHILGSYASEIIATACVMIEAQLRADEIMEIIFPHPSVGEIIKDVTNTIL